MQTAPPNLLADYLYLRQTAVVKQAIDTARTSVPSGGHSSSYLCQQDSVFAAQDRRFGMSAHTTNTVCPIKSQLIHLTVCRKRARLASHLLAIRLATRSV